MQVAQFEKDQTTVQAAVQLDVASLVAALAQPLEVADRPADADVVVAALASVRDVQPELAVVSDAAPVVVNAAPVLLAQASPAAATPAAAAPAAAAEGEEIDYTTWGLGALGLLVVGAAGGGSSSNNSVVGSDKDNVNDDDNDGIDDGIDDVFNVPLVADGTGTFDAKVSYDLPVAEVNEGGEEIAYRFTTQKQSGDGEFTLTLIDSDLTDLILDKDDLLISWDNPEVNGTDDSQYVLESFTGAEVIVNGATYYLNNDTFQDVPVLPV